MAAEQQLNTITEYRVSYTEHYNNDKPAEAKVRAFQDSNDAVCFAQYLSKGERAANVDHIERVTNVGIASIQTITIKTAIPVWASNSQQQG